MPQVIFYRDLEFKAVFAYFPRLKFNDRFFTCYLHIGQHSACSKEYVLDRDKCEPCENESEYIDLLNELKSIGYKDLKVKNCIKTSK